MNWISMLGLGGWLQRMRKVASLGAVAVEQRLELASLEWYEHKQRLLLQVLVATVALVFAAAFCVALSAVVIISFWDSPQRMLVAWLVVAFWAILLVIVLFILRNIVCKSAGFFVLTRTELAKDWHGIRDSL